MVVDQTSLTVGLDDLGDFSAELCGESAVLLTSITGGVLGLLDALARAREPQLSDVWVACRPWAERLFPDVVADPLLMLQVWTGLLPESSFLALATEALGRPVTVRETRRLRERSCFTDVGRGPALPWGLVGAIKGVVLERDPESARPIRRAVSAAMAKPGPFNALARIRVLTSVRDWVALDEVLATSGYLLAALSREQRLLYAVLWPRESVRGLVHLTHASRFVRGELSTTVLTYGSATPLHELACLSLVAAPPPRDTLYGEFHHRLGHETAHRSLDRTVAMAEIAELVQWTDEWTRRLGHGEQPAHPDDLALLVVLLIGTAEAALWLGLIAEARHACNAALEFSRALAPAHPDLGTLLSNVLAVISLLDAFSGATRQAAERIREYHAALSTYRNTGPDPDRMVDIASQMVANATDPPERPATVIDPNALFAPLEASTEAARLVLLEGPTFAREWLRGILGQGSWARRPIWVWWPAHSVMALLEIREGHAAAAESWVARSYLPPPLQTALQAHLHLLHGRSVAACALAESMMADPGMPHRLRLIGAGVPLGCSCPSSESDAREALLVTGEWRSSLDAAALMPAAARRRLLQYDPSIPRLPGLIVPDHDEPEPDDVKLTPRQLDVLEALQSDLTLAQIAKQRFLSVETIRSTTKSLYRRLGVGDREAAVAAGRSLGLI